jgi:transposase
MANARAVYPWEVVQAIRSAYAAGGQTMAQVGALFGVSTSTVCNYVNRTIRKFA